MSCSAFVTDSCSSPTDGHVQAILPQFDVEPLPVIAVFAVDVHLSRRSDRERSVQHSTTVTRHNIQTRQLRVLTLLVHGQVTIIFVVIVCLFVCAEFFSAVFDPISIKLGHMLYVWV